VNEPTPLPDDALPLQSKLRLHQACRDFEKAWRAGQVPEIGRFLPEAPQAERLAFARELILLDLDYRRSGGHPCLAEDYLARFPELDRTWLLAACAGGPEADGRTVDFAGGSSGDEPGGPLPSPTTQGADASRIEVAVRRLVSGEYELLEEIGRGGMGVVYKARQVGLNRLVALKMILAGEHASEASLRRFRVEAEAAARLQHEGVVRVYDVGHEAGRPYLVMEYVEGGSLKDRLDGTPWPCRQAAQLVERLAGIIHAAHENRIVHRDLTPANVLLTPQGQVKVTDFGLARLIDEVGARTQTGDVLGTPSYMAPEQARGQSKYVGPPADVWALGAILYELLTGRPPFRGATTMDTLLQVIGDKPVPARLLNSRIDRDLDTVCLKCLEKDPAKRYASAAALAEDLGRYRDGRSVRARPPGWADAVVRGLGSLSEQFEHTLWAKISLAAALIGLAFHLTVYWLVHTRQPAELWWLTVGTGWVLLGGAFAYYLGPRRHTLTRAEAQVLTLWGGHLLGTVVLWVALGAPFDRSLLTTFYPAYAVLTGLMMLVQGSIYWGRFYLVGLAYFALALVMPFTPDWAPLEMALMYSSTQAASGWYLLRHPDR
jgi:predicted Ser/Thr protein kinase